MEGKYGGMASSEGQSAEDTGDENANKTEEGSCEQCLDTQRSGSCCQKNGRAVAKRAGVAQ